MHQDLELIQKFLVEQLTAYETAQVPNLRRIAEAKEALRAVDRVTALLALGAKQ